MKNVLIVGLGQVGSALYSIFHESKSFKTYGVDQQKEKWINLSPKLTGKTQIDVIHFCFPYSKTFIDDVFSYVTLFQPEFAIIESTVPVGTTQQIAEYFPNIVHSPIRGRHLNKETMITDIKRWIKFIGGDPVVSEKVRSHYAELMIVTKYLGTSDESELAKLFSTTYYGWMITFFQEAHRLTKQYGDIDPIKALSLIKDDNAVEHNKPVFYPDVIGGHCVMENLNLIRSTLFSETINYSNSLRIKELNDEQIKKEIQKIKDWIK